MSEGVTITHLNPDSGERFQPLRRELGVSTFGFNLITLQPGERGRVHEHQRQEEVFVILEGVLDLVSSDETKELAEGDCVRVAPKVRRQLVNRGPGRLVLIALGGSNEHDGRDGVAYASWDAQTGGSPQEVTAPDNLSAAELRAGGAG